MTTPRENSDRTWRFWKKPEHGPYPRRSIADKIDASGDCWIWTATINPAGYGRQRNQYAHRLVWELLVGAIPNGMEIDHLCKNHACVNPDHLEVVTRLENTRRGYTSSRFYCPEGHIRIERKWKQRACKTCNTNRARQKRRLTTG